MTLTEYQQLAHKTSAFAATGVEQYDNNITMALLGLCGEVGELADMIKKQRYHDHSFSPSAAQLELGDILWYLAEACSAFGFSLDEIAVSNIAKLQARYGNAFSTEASINRKD